MRDQWELEASTELMRQLAQALHHRVDELEALFDMLPIGLAIADDVRCRYIRVNAALARLLDLPHGANASLDGPAGERPAYRVLRSGREIPVDELPLHRAAREGVPITDFDCEIVRADGRSIPILMQASPLFDERGRSRGALGAVVEVGDRVRIEREQRFLADASRVLASSLDHDTTLGALADLSVPMLADYCMVDILRDDGTVRRVAMATSETEKLDVLRELQRYPPLLSIESAATRVIRSGEPLVCEEISDSLVKAAAQNAEHEQLLRAFGVRSFAMAPLRARGRTLGLFTVGMLSNARTLRARDLPLVIDVASRAALALDNAILYRDAQTANRLKDDFLATLSHELRTPLNALLGWAQILRAQLPEGAVTRRAIDSIDRNAHAQLVLINDLLDVSRVISGKLRLDHKPVDLAAVVSAAIEAIRPAARGREIELAVTVAPLRLEVLGDADRLQQVVWNLASNAVKFTPRGGRVDVSVDEKNDAVQVTVSDTGAGIDPAFLPYVFDRFRQGDSSTTRAQGGLGLGLAIVRHLVDLHGGSVTAYSPGRDRGTRFVVTLPAQKPRRARPARPLPIAPRPPTLRGVRVLVVDDEPDARELLQLVLESASAEVCAVDAVTTAIDVLVAFRPMVVIADIAMPGQDGYELLRRIRDADPTCAPVPVVAVTAYASQEDAGRALAAGFARHLGKPVDHELLIRTVAEVVPDPSKTVFGLTSG
jgi:signal transduction histidine kinase/ActR/RegA family two-component response regulator